MQTKLTLSLDDRIINIAKNYALRKNKSVSKIIEDYFKVLEKIDFDLENAFKGNLTEKIAGMFKEEYHGSEYRDILEAALMEKFL